MLLWIGLVRSFKAQVYKRRERERVDREIEIGYDEDTFEEIFVTNIVVQISWIGCEIQRIDVFLYIVYRLFSFF